MGLFFVRNRKISRASFVHSGASGLLGIEVVLTWLACQNLAVLSHFQAFCVWFSCFHRKLKARMGDMDILQEIKKLSRENMLLVIQYWHILILLLPCKSNWHIVRYHDWKAVRINESLKGESDLKGLYDKYRKSTRTVGGNAEESD